LEGCQPALLFGLFACGELGGVPWPVNTVHTTPRKHGLMNHRRTLVIADVDAGIAKGHGGLSIATLLPWKKNLGGRPRRGWRVSKTFLCSRQPGDEIGARISMLAGEGVTSLVER
jgi:hypothetical protein